MKPFDLEAFKAGKPAVTRDGRSVRFLGTLVGEQTPIVIAIYDPTDNKEIVTQVHKNGNFWLTEWTPNDIDLFMPSEKKEGWVVLHRNEIEHICSTIESAQERKRHHHIPEDNIIAHITWEE